MHFYSSNCIQCSSTPNRHYAPKPTPSPKYHVPKALEDIKDQTKAVENDLKQQKTDTNALVKTLGKEVPPGIASMWSPCRCCPLVDALLGDLLINCPSQTRFLPLLALLPPCPTAQGAPPNPPLPPPYHCRMSHARLRSSISLKKR